MPLPSPGRKCLGSSLTPALSRGEGDATIASTRGSVGSRGGAPHDMPPEQRAAITELHPGRPITVAVDGRSDIHALGLVLYRMLGGAIAIGPYPMHRIAFHRPPRVPVGLADIVAKCPAVDPRDRYADAGQLAEDLRRHPADLPLRGVSNRSLTERWRKWCRRHPHGLVRAAMTALTSSALILVAWRIARGETRRRLRGAESLLAESRKHQDRHNDPAAARALNHGLALIDQSRVRSFPTPSVFICGSLISFARRRGVSGTPPPGCRRARRSGRPGP